MTILKLAPADVLDKAAALIEVNGWCQGEAVDDRGRFCALGAIENSVEGGTSLDADDVANLLRKFLDLYAISDWNDEPERTQDEVTSALRECAAQLRAAS